MKEVLEKLYDKYNRFELIKPDPLQFVYRYSEKRDMEIAGFLAALLAYGRVRQIEKSADELLGRMGKTPFEFTVNFGKAEREKLSDFKHRFNTGDDIADLMQLLRQVIKEFGNIEKCFMAGFNAEDENIIGALSKFCQRLISLYERNNGRAAPAGLRYLLSDPAKGSTCKRLNMFLRWMIRDDDVDAGLWKGVDKSKLIVPIDTHMARLCKILGLYDKKTVNLKTAIEVTQRFAEIETVDPVKYDFALSRIGIVEDCTGKYRPQCENCELLVPFCRQRS
ncbi:MAG: TIGR02757 family protein [Sedimentisphaerales bacterium]|nr:TIGR02757 family protein [Sedimentisphaerales bacterium]